MKARFVLPLCLMAFPACAAQDKAVPSFSETTGAPYSDEDEAVYMTRFNKLVEDARTGAGLGSYDLLEPVEGAASNIPIPVATENTLSAEALAKARTYAAERNSSAFLVWRDGKLEEESYFGEFGHDTPIVSKSLAKPVTALLIGRALRQGHIQSLDQPVADFITEWKGDAQREKIKIRYLLDMRTGLLPQGFSIKSEDILNRAYLHPRHEAVIINDYPVTHEPGTRYEYSNANSELVAVVIERAAGQRYGDYLSEALLKPIGVKGGSIWVNRPSGVAHSGCCLLLPARSWLRMGILLLNDGIWDGERLLPEGYVQEMRTGTAENPYYGMAVWLVGKYIDRRGFANPSIPFGKVLHSEPYADKDIFLFDGNSNQVVYMVRSENMIILRTGANPPKDKEWDNSFLPNLLIHDANRAPGDAMPEPQPR